MGCSWTGKVLVYNVHRHRKLSVFVGALPLYIDLIAEYVYVSRNATRKMYDHVFQCKLNT